MTAAAVTVTFDVPAGGRRALLTTVHDTLVADPHLSPRTPGSLRRACERGCLAVARDGDQVVGWLLCLPLGRDVQELAGAYVRPDRRGTTVATRLLAAALGRARHTICVTSDRALARYLRAFWGFRRCPLHRAARLAGLALLRDRASPSRLRYVRSRLRLTRHHVLVLDRSPSEGEGHEDDRRP